MAYDVAILFTGCLLLASATMDYSDYLWKEGEWGECVYPGCGEGGQQYRNIWCEHKSGWSTIDVNCNRFRKPKNTQGCFRICEHHRYEYNWRSGPWSTCAPLEPNHCGHLAYGQQTRTVQCRPRCSREESGPVAEEICSRFEVRPIDRKECWLNCSQDCVVGEFGEWSTCESCVLPIRTRHRAILIPPRFGGESCIPVRESQRCVIPKFCYIDKSIYRKYRLGAWSECMRMRTDDELDIPSSEVIGHRRRTIDCTDNMGMIIDKKNCAHLDAPISAELCIIAQDCLVTTWSNWKYEKPKPGELGSSKLMRERNIIKISRGTGKKCPKLREDKFSLSEDETKCYMYSWKLGSWKKCMPSSPFRTKCANGIRNRTVLCLRKADKVPVESRYCGHDVPGHMEACALPCIHSCVTTQWSQWSECSPHKCKVRKNVLSYRVRKREVISSSSPYPGSSSSSSSSPSSVDAGCPHLLESRICQLEDCYKWSSVSTACRPTYSDMECGEGFATAVVVCKDMDQHTVQSKLCNTRRPPSRRACNVPCPMDCVVSRWTQWSSCSERCGKGESSRVRRILAMNGNEGVPCPTKLIDVRSCGAKKSSCSWYHWKAGEWTMCRARRSRLCGQGQQFRQVTCFRNTGYKTTIKRCMASKRPLSRRDCVVPCPIDCVVSEWSEWSECPYSCKPDVFSKDSLPQTRVRHVIHVPRAGGQDCPSTTQHRQCLATLTTCSRYSWKLALWSDCRFMSGRCGSGLMQREVTCVGDNRELLPREFCVSQLGGMPESVHDCKVDCGYTDTRHVDDARHDARHDASNDARIIDAPTLCLLSEWTEWSMCQHGCRGTTTRQRVMQGETNKIAACYDELKYPIKEEKGCVCHPYSVHSIGEWSSCIATLEEDCGVGVRTQSLVCSSEKLDNVHPSVCESRDFGEEMCFTACPRDCLMSAWSEWSACHVTKRCGLGEMTRSRHVVNNALDGGRECPKLTDGEEFHNKPCTRPCHHFRWDTEEWSPCSALSRITVTNCGSGIQSRVVRCKRKSKSEWVTAEESDCDVRSKPEMVNYCQVSCPGQCVVGDWSAWSKCEECNKSSRLSRSRDILRHPAKGSSIRCPHVTENEVCNPTVNCDEPTWEWSSWGDCELPSNIECGNGTSIRVKQCILIDRQPIDEENCSNSDFVDPLVEERRCRVTCAQDCSFDQWTQWSSCQHSCGVTKSTRSRKIIVKGGHGGRECNNQVEQQRPCPYKECFTWTIGQWSSCSIEKGTCGFGSSSRNLTCLRHDGVVMSSSLCKAERLYHTKKECFIACPGDCILSDWTEWTPCERPCKQDFTLEGSQTRSRSIIADPVKGRDPCQHPLYETRSCGGGDAVGVSSNKGGVARGVARPEDYCPTYSWHTSYWFGARRAVWCQRSDGLPVIGGCKGLPKPTTLKICDPPCKGRVNNSYCQDTNNCRCITGYASVYNEHSYLTECVLIIMVFNRSRGDVQPEAVAPDDNSSYMAYVIIGTASFILIFLVVGTYFFSRNEIKSNQMNVEDFICENRAIPEAKLEDFK